jgi:hypothetical protein
MIAAVVVVFEGAGLSGGLAVVVCWLEVALALSAVVVLVTHGDRGVVGWSDGGMPAVVCVATVVVVSK